MAYIDIYREVAGVTGNTSTSQESFVKSLINKAAEDLYSQSDLVNCLREQLFIKDDDSTPQVLQFTLPWYVWKLRAIREYNTGIKISTHDMRPRYQTQGWKEFLEPYLYRTKYNLPISKNIINEGALTLSLPDGETVATAFSVTIVGSNASKARFTETVNFVAGDTEKTTNNVFQEIESIRKSAVTEFDLYVYDPDDRELSYIPNSELGPFYTLIQISDYPYINPQYIEVLYKTRFVPFHNDADEFPCGNIYDKAIVYKTLEQYYITYRKEFETATGYHIKCNEHVNNIACDFSDGNEKEIDFGSNRYLNMLPSYTSRTGLNPIFRVFRGGIV